MLNRAQVKKSIKQSLAWVDLGRAARGTVLLTFDDGPHPESTPAALRLLREYNARAIFFVVGSRIERAPHLLKRILDEGHALGNHSFAHPLDGRPPFRPYLKDLEKCQEHVERLTGSRPRFFRPPLGAFSLTSYAAPKLLGLKTVLWSVDAYDWDLKSADEARLAADNLAAKLSTSTSRNDIVLMHDDHPYVETVLGAGLRVLAEQGCDLHSALDAIGHTATPAATRR
jgi:peptidoglycan/xylan/chitin deacetylase (PgdA/CDA1 family)